MRYLVLLSSLPGGWIIYITLRRSSGSRLLVASSLTVLEIIVGSFGLVYPAFLPLLRSKGGRVNGKTGGGLFSCYYHCSCTGRPVSTPQTLRKLLPRVFHVFVTSPLLLSLFGWHSCRRGGATHGYHNGVTLDLLAPHGGWFTQQGLKAYTSAAFEQRLSVTLRM